MSQSLLLIFAKHPVPNQVKTRLAAGIGHEKALQVYEALLAHTLATVLPIDADKHVFYGNEVPENDIWSEAGFNRDLQDGADLGDRMAHAFAFAFRKGYEKVVVIGTDCPEITPEILTHAFRQLDNNEVVVGPATDGGYYLLGMRRFYPDLFKEIPWSTDEVFKLTRNALRAKSISFSLLPELHDIDVVEDLTGTFLEALTKDA